jgi:hypothetical protein
VRQIRHQGTSLGWDQEGNFTIDATDVAEEVLGPSGAELPAAGKGTITLVNQDLGQAKLSVVLDASSSPGKVLLGSDPTVAATEPFVCGNLFVTAIEALIDAIKNVATTTPAPLDPASKAALEQTKAAFTTALSLFIMGKKAQ